MKNTDYTKPVDEAFENPSFSGHRVGLSSRVDSENFSFIGQIAEAKGTDPLTEIMNYLDISQSGGYE